MSVRIGAVHAYIAIGPDDEEGIVGAYTSDGLVPMIAADENRLKSLQPIAEALAAAKNMTVRLVKFSTREDVGIIEPGEKLKSNTGDTLTPEMDSFKNSLMENVAGIRKSEFFLNLWNPSMSDKNIEEFAKDPWPTIQLGIAIMLGKPIVVLALNDRLPIPEKLAAIADFVATGDNIDEAMTNLIPYLIEKGIIGPDTQPKDEALDTPPETRQG